MRWALGSKYFWFTDSQVRIYPAPEKPYLYFMSYKTWLIESHSSVLFPCLDLVSSENLMNLIFIFLKTSPTGVVFTSTTTTENGGVMRVILAKWNSLITNYSNSWKTTGHKKAIKKPPRNTMRGGLIF